MYISKPSSICTVNRIYVFRHFSFIRRRTSCLFAHHIKNEIPAIFTAIRFRCQMNDAAKMSFYFPEAVTNKGEGNQKFLRVHGMMFAARILNVQMYCIVFCSLISNLT